MDSSIFFDFSSILSFSGSLTNEHRDVGIATDIFQLLKKGKGVDLKFVFNHDKPRYAQQLILATRSPYLADQFYDERKKKKKEYQIIHVGNADPDAVDGMIRYCYGIKPCLRTIEEASKLIMVAKRFKVMTLIQLCREFLRDKKIEPENVFNMLDASECMKDESLRDKCYKILEDKTREVLSLYKLRDVTPSMIRTILGLPKLFLYSEYELTKWLFEWAKAKFQDEYSWCENLRECLDKLLPEINFLSLTLEEFAELCKDYPDFFSAHEIASVYLNIAYPGAREMPHWYDKDMRIRVYTGTKE